jgi:hypothetical protein
MKEILKKIIFYSKLKKIYFFFLIIFYNLKKNYYDEKFQPVFMISANRSGSSLIGSIIRQHPSLRSLSEDVLNFKMIKKDSHTYGFSEDFIWNFLDDYDNDHFTGKDEGCVWSDPKYISNFYRDNFFFKNALRYEIYKVKSNKIPFVKHSFFTLRLKLIKKLFPKAKIILNVRSFKDFISSNLHKWSKDKRYKKTFQLKTPDVGLHWYLLNSIALYQLNKYFKDQYFIFYHEKLYDEKVNKQEIMNELTNFMGLENFDFNFSNVNPEHKFNKEITYNYEIPNFASKIGEYEREIYEEFKKNK